MAAGCSLGSDSEGEQRVTTEVHACSRIDVNGVPEGETASENALASVSRKVTRFFVDLLNNSL
jgi:hypothetical protein